jgi:hypothetical protein
VVELCERPKEDWRCTIAAAVAIVLGETEIMVSSLGKKRNAYQILVRKSLRK